MRRINDNEVQLTDAELESVKELDELMNNGHSLLEGVSRLLSKHGHKLTIEFYSYLVDGYWSHEFINELLSNQKIVC